jgi:hypothetical protein
MDQLRYRLCSKATGLTNSTRGMTSKQGSIASFFNKKPVPKVAPKPNTGIKHEIEGRGGIIDLTDEVPDIKTMEEESPRKRRKLSPGLDPKLKEASPLKAKKDDSSPKAKTEDRSEYLTIDPLTAFTYPPASHPSYHPPPSPSHNHPFSIPSPSTILLSNLSFNPTPKIIVKPELNLDLLYFNQFIASGSKELYTYLLDSLPWYRVTYTTKGFTVNTPRWTTVFGKDSAGKEWSGYPTGVKPRAIPEILLRLMEIGMSPLPLSVSLSSALSSILSGWKMKKEANK